MPPSVMENIQAFLAVGGAMTAVILFILKLMLSDALSKSNESLLLKINGTYLRKELATERFGHVNTRLDEHARILNGER